jgi:hypothetical protein
VGTVPVPASSLVGAEGLLPPESMETGGEVAASLASEEPVGTALASGAGASIPTPPSLDSSTPAELSSTELQLATSANVANDPSTQCARMLMLYLTKLRGRRRRLVRPTHQMDDSPPAPARKSVGP